MTIDISKIRPGDTVHVKGTVKSRLESIIYVQSGGGVEFTAVEKEIIAHIPKPREWKVGDRVKIKGHANHWHRLGYVRDICGEMAWLEVDCLQDFLTAPLSDLEAP